MTKLKEITNYIETLAPLSLQESYDNAGLITGNYETKITNILVTLDVTEKVLEEAIRKNIQLIVAHHPLVFSGLKKITGKNFVERCLIKAIKNDIAIYAGHTNLDSVKGGVNSKICEKLGLEKCKILKPAEGQLKKLVTFIPTAALEKVSEALFNAGAGNLGNYDSCGYYSEGKGSFRGNKEANPFVGKKGEIHYEKEIRFETIFPEYLQKNILQALLSNHPYEEVAYDIYSLGNNFENTGMGMIGELPVACSEKEFLSLLKTTFIAGVVKHTAFRQKTVKRIAVCGGSGSFLLKEAICANADFFVSSDFKYHQFFDAEDKIVIADIGHYESEQFTMELFYELLMKKFPNFAVHLSEVNTNPVFYF